MLFQFIFRLSQPFEDDYIYFSTLERLQRLHSAMNDSERLTLEKLIAPILSLPYLYPIIYLNLLTLLSEEAQNPLLARLMIKWKEDFLHALKAKDLGGLCDCL